MTEFQRMMNNHINKSYIDYEKTHGWKDNSKQKTKLSGGTVLGSNPEMRKKFNEQQRNIDAEAMGIIRKGVTMSNLILTPQTPLEAETQFKLEEKMASFMQQLQTTINQIDSNPPDLQSWDITEMSDPQGFSELLRTYNIMMSLINNTKMIQSQVSNLKTKLVQFQNPLNIALYSVSQLITTTIDYIVSSGENPVEKNRLQVGIYKNTELYTALSLMKNNLFTSVFTMISLQDIHNTMKQKMTELFGAYKPYLSHIFETMHINGLKDEKIEILRYIKAIEDRTGKKISDEERQRIYYLFQTNTLPDYGIDFNTFKKLPHQVTTNGFLDSTYLDNEDDLQTAQNSDEEESDGENDASDLESAQGEPRPQADGWDDDFEPVGAGRRGKRVVTINKPLIKINPRANNLFADKITRKKIFGKKK